MAFLGVPSGANNTEARDILSTSKVRYEGVVRDNIFNDFVTLDILRKKDRMRTQNGGLSIGITVEYAKNTTFSELAYFDTIDTSPQKNFQTAEYKWGYYAVSVSLSHQEVRQNAGDNIVNLVDGKFKSAMSSVSDLINQHLYASSFQTNRINTLVTLIDATSTIGEVNSTAQTFWQATNTTGGSFGAQGMSDLETTYNAVSSSANRSAPDILVTTSTIHGFYNLALQAQQRYSSNDTAASSFINLKFKNADIVWDEVCTAGVIYLLNSNALELIIDSGTNFIFTDP